MKNVMKNADEKCDVDLKHLSAAANYLAFVNELYIFELGCCSC